jgi:hypothetical protein
MTKHKEPLVSIRVGEAAHGTINPLWELRIIIGNLDIQIQLGGLFTYWRYCKKCGSILEHDGCSNFLCATHTKPEEPPQN